MKEIKYLFIPIKVGSVEIKNRIAMAPTGSNLASPEGDITPKQIGYYEARARGGVGLIIVEDTTIGPNYIHNTTSLADDRFIPGWKKLTKTVHAYGAKIMPQIFHPAFNAPSARNSGMQPVSASPIPSRMLREIPRELTLDEIKKIIRQFGETALRAQEGGCDGIQLHCAHMHHLLGSFVTPYYNKRTDSYGGSLEGRWRLPLEIIRHIRSNVGSGFAVLIRISGNEYLPGGRTLDESVYMAPILEEAGADAIHISGGTSTQTWIGIPPTGSPQASNADAAAAVKRAVHVPVICVGRITTPWAAENVLATGKADMVAMARALIADPDWPHKAAKGNWQDIVPCMGDTQCLVSVATGHNIRCSINASSGQEEEAALVPAENPKTVMVVGGGPAGLEAARVAALRGHRVTLMEKGPKLGGQLLLATFPPMKQEYACAVQYLSTQAYKAGVKVELNTQVTPDLIDKLKPDVVIIATGSVPLIPEIPGTDGKNVVTAWDVLSGRVFPGPNAAVIGGGKVGCETADYLAHIVDDLQPGANRVTIIEMLDNIVLDDFSPWRSVLIQRLKSKGVKIITQAKVTEILPDGVKYLKDAHEETLRGINHIVLAMGTQSDHRLTEQLKGSPIPTLVIGDAKEPHTALEAIAEGWKIGKKI